MKNEGNLVKLVRSVANKPHSRETISPERARQLLDSRKNFRPLVKRHARKILDALRADRELFVKDGTPIRTSDDGLLYDGQHRCWAISELGSPTDVIVQIVDHTWWGDHGKSRSEADYIRNQLGEQPRHAKFSAVAKMITNLARRDAAAFRSSSGSNATEAARDWSDEIQWALTEVGDWWAGDPKRMTSGGAATCAAFAIARRHSSTAATNLAGRCKTGNMNGGNDPAAALRRFVARVAGPGSDARVRLIVGCAEAIQAESLGKRLVAIRAGTTGDDIVSAANWLFGGK